MPYRIDRRSYAETYGPTTGDRVRLADTDLFVQVERDLVAEGVIDPTKVVRCALQDAASIAGLLVTTEAMVAELPKRDSGHAQLPMGGGMDF